MLHEYNKKCSTVAVILDNKRKTSKENKQQKPYTPQLRLFFWGMIFTVLKTQHGSGIPDALILAAFAHVPSQSKRFAFTQVSDPLKKMEFCLIPHLFSHCISDVSAPSSKPSHIPPWLLPQPPTREPASRPLWKWQQHPAWTLLAPQALWTLLHSEAKGISS